MSKISTPLEIKLFDALKRIAAYETPERLHKNAEKSYGIDGAEAIEYAYENVLEEAKRATKGIRLRRPATIRQQPGDTSDTPLTRPESQ